MRALTLPLGLVAAAATTLAVLQPAADARPSRDAGSAQRVTMSAHPTLLRWGQGATLFGAVDNGRANEEVLLQARDCGQSSFANVSGVLTHEGGTWTTQFTRAITTTVRAVWKGATSAPVTLRQQPNVELRKRAGKRFAVSVLSRGQFWRKRVLLQRRVGSRWTTLRSVVLTDTAAPPGAGTAWAEAEFRLSVPRGWTLRALLPASQARPCFVQTASATLRT